MAYKSDGGPKGGQTAGGRAAGDVGGRGGMGGMSGNRGSDKAGRDVAAKRPVRTDQNFITPNYSWDQAQISDFGITGGLMNLGRGILAGNTYAGRQPLGFGSGGNVGARSGGGGEKMNPMLLARQQAAPQMFMPQQQAPAATRPLMPMGYQSGQMFGTGGKYGGSSFRPGYSFLTPGSY